MTNVEIKPACLRDASYVIANMRSLDAREVLCQVPEDTPRHELAYGLIMGSDAYVAYVDGRPAMVYGTSPINMVCGSLWALGTDRCKRAIPAITRHVLYELAPALHEAGFSSLEARSIVEHREAHRWMTSTGAVVHGPDFVYGRGGEMFRLFRWTPEAFAKARKRYRS